MEVQTCALRCSESNCQILQTPNRLLDLKLSMLLILQIGLLIPLGRHSFSQINTFKWTFSCPLRMFMDWETVSITLNYALELIHFGPQDRLHVTMTARAEVVSLVSILSSWLRPCKTVVILEFSSVMQTLWLQFFAGMMMVQAPSASLLSVDKLKPIFSLMAQLTKLSKSIKEWSASHYSPLTGHSAGKKPPLSPHLTI